MSGTYDGKLIYGTKVDTEGFEKGTEDIKKKAKQTSEDVKKSLEATRDSLEGINKTAKKIALGAAAIGAGIVSVGVSYNSQMEQYSTGFSTMLGDAEKAQKLIGDLKGFAAETPFELTDLANASTTLLAFGEDVNQLMPDLKMLGDISLGNSEKFKGLALVFGQVQSQGRLMGQDLLQMINQGFNPLQIISEKTGKSVATLKDEMAQGKITFEMVADAMKTATSEGGQFYNAMKNQSKTLAGQWSTLKDNVVALTGEMSEGISEELTETVLPKLIDLVEELSRKWEDGSLQDAIGTATAAVVTFGTAVGALNVLLFAADMRKIVQGVKDYTTATKAGAAAQKLMNAELLKNPYTLALAAVVALTAGIITYMATHKSAASELTDSVKNVKEAHDNAVQSIEDAKIKEEAAAETARTYQQELFNLDKQLKDETITQEEANAVAEEFRIVASKLEELIPGITDYLFDETGEINLQNEAVKNLADAYYELMIAKASANAAEKLMAQTSEDIVAQRKIQKEAEKTKADAKDKIGLLPGSLVYGQYGWEYVVDSEDWSLGNQRKAAYEIGRIEAADKAYNEAAEAIEQYNQEQETNIALLEEENKKIKAILDANKDLSEEQEKNGDKVVTTTKQASKEVSKDFETRYKNLKRSLDREEITHAGYYEQLRKLRYEYFAEGSEEWQKYTDELKDFSDDTFDDCLDTLDDFKNESLDKIRELKDEQEDLKEKMITDKAPIIWGKIDGQSFTSLANYDQEINQLQLYGNMFDRLLEKRGELPQSVLDELKAMDTEQAMRYMQALLNSSDSQYDAFIQARQKLEEEASKNSKKLMSSEMEQMKQILEDKFGELPEDFFKLGDESASAFGEAFLLELQSAMDTVRSTIMAEMSSFVPTFSFAAAGGSAGTTNITNQVQNVLNASKSTITEQLSAINRASTLDRLRGIMGGN